MSKGLQFLPRKIYTVFNRYCWFWRFFSNQRLGQSWFTMIILVTKVNKEWKENQNMKRTNKMKKNMFFLQFSDLPHNHTLCRKWIFVINRIKDYVHDVYARALTSKRYARWFLVRHVKSNGCLRSPFSTEIQNTMCCFVCAVWSQELNLKIKKYHLT